MLTQDKLQQVAATTEAITAAVVLLDQLRDDEEKVQPPGERRVALTKIARTLETQRGVLERLWS